MSQDGAAVKLDVPGPNGGSLVLVTDFQSKQVSLIEVAPARALNNKVLVWEVQDYTKTGN